MSSLIVEVCLVDKVLKHTNADKLEIVLVKGWECIVQKGAFAPGDKVIFVPPDAVLPESLAVTWGVKPYLSKSNKVKSVKLRGTYSFGIVVSASDPKWKVGDNIAEELGITKWVPPVPKWHSQSRRAPSIAQNPLVWKYTDIENIRNYHNVFEEGEEVVATLKIHGTCVGFGMINGEWVARSKSYQRAMPTLRVWDTKNFWGKIKLFVRGQSKKTIPDNEAIASNWWWYPFTLPSVRLMIGSLYTKGYKQIMLYGETYGSNVQKLHYNVKGLEFRAFDLLIDGRWLHHEEFVELCQTYGVSVVPTIYRGPFNLDHLKTLAQGHYPLNGETHVSEGLVIRSVLESTSPKLGRRILKLINPEYLVEKDNHQGEPLETEAE